MAYSEECYTLVALCAVGAEKICANELRKLGGESGEYRILDCGFGRVTFQSALPGIYRALCALRTADRVLLRCAAFDAEDFDALFSGVRAAELERFIPPGAAITITKVRAQSSKLAAETSIQAVVHKAAADRLCSARGVARLPEAESGAPRFEFRVYLKKNRAELLLDLSGEPLFRRGYRKSGGGAAPLRETSAAALVLASGWRRKFPLYDPFCGSGTIAIEAALFACAAAPNLHRAFALDGLLIAGEACSRNVRAALLAAADPDAAFDIQGSDADTDAVRQAKENARRAFEAAGISPARAPLFNTVLAENARSYKEIPGFIITNPPYGKRLGTPEEAESAYQKMAGLRDRFPGWKMAVLSDHAGFESFFGHKASACAELTNGIYKTYLYKFEGETRESGGGAGEKSGGRNERGEGRPPSGGARPESRPKNAAPRAEKHYTW